MDIQEFMDALNGRSIVKTILEEGNTTPPVKIKTIITSDGYEFDFENLIYLHPAYEKEKADFIARVEKSKPESFFIFNPQQLTLDEMRGVVAAHAKQINANGGNVGGHQGGGYKVTFGEDLATLKRWR